MGGQVRLLLAPSGNQALPSSKSLIVLTVFVLASTCIDSPTVMLILLQDTLLPVAARKPCALSLGAGFVSSPGRVLCPQHPSDQAPQGEDCVHSTPVMRLPRERTVSTAPQ